MRVAVVGAGYVGLVTAACLAELGHDVTAVEQDRRKLQLLEARNCPIHEELLPGLVEKHWGKTLYFTASLQDAMQQAQVVFICVATPASHNGSTDLSCLDALVREISKLLQHKVLLVEKSTVPVRTCDAIRQTLISGGAHPEQFAVACNPEFLREGTAVVDFLVPDRIVIGTDDEFSREILRDLYSPLTSGQYYKHPESVAGGGARRPQLIDTSVRSAELIKHAANAFLAMKIAFINGVANLAEAYRADIDDVCHGLGADRRIGPHFLRAGLGFGGACLPKDVRAFAAMAQQSDYSFPLLAATTKMNQRQRLLFARKVQKALGSVRGRQIACLGVAFKAGTDDVRNSPAIDIIKQLVSRGARISAFDPAASQKASQELAGLGVSFEVDPYQAMDGADALVILTEWPEFGSLDLARVRGLLQRPLIVDGRNMYSPETMRKAGFSYWSCGREPVLSQPVTARRSAGDPPTLLSMIPSLESVSVTQRTGGP